MDCITIVQWWALNRVVWRSIYLYFIKFEKLVQEKANAAQKQIAWLRFRNRRIWRYIWMFTIILFDIIVFIVNIELAIVISLEIICRPILMNWIINVKLVVTSRRQNIVWKFIWIHTVIQNTNAPFAQKYVQLEMHIHIMKHNIHHDTVDYRIEIKPKITEKDMAEMFPDRNKK